MNAIIRIAIVALALSVLSAAQLNAQETTLPPDPLSDVARTMHGVVGLLEKFWTNQPTQTQQKEVVSKLDALILELEKECEACKNGQASANPKRPAQDSVIKAGPGGMGRMHAPPPDGKKWGELPPHERDRILQSLTEGFPAHYQKILERYYRRLAEEKGPAALEEAAGSSARSDAQSAPAVEATEASAGGNAATKNETAK